jgi:hypothetical protein
MDTHPTDIRVTALTLVLAVIGDGVTVTVGTEGNGVSMSTIVKRLPRRPVMEVPSLTAPRRRRIQLPRRMLRLIRPLPRLLRSIHLNRLHPAIRPNLTSQNNESPGAGDQRFRQ